MISRTMSLLVFGGAVLWSGSALAETAYLEGRVFNKRSGGQVEGAAVIVYENVPSGSAPIFLLSEYRTDPNGFYQVPVTSSFPTRAIAVFCRTPSGAVVRADVSAPLQDGAIRRRDVYLEAPRDLRRCLDPKPGDIPFFRR